MGGAVATRQGRNGREYADETAVNLRTKQLYYSSVTLDRARWATQAVHEALSDTPVVVVNGARQVGKTTLARGLAFGGTHQFVSLDDPAARAFAKADPRGFVDRNVDTFVIDEVQLEPALFRAIKASVDIDRRPGRFLLTGSSRLLSAPDMADSLVGRVEAVELWPFSQGEIDGRREGFVETIVQDLDSLLSITGTGRQEVLERICRGGFPELIERRVDRRAAWFNSYVTTTIEKVVREIGDLERLAEIPRLLRLCAARTAGELNIADVSNQLGIPARTGGAYMARLSSAFLVQLIPAWATNLSAKVVRKPKLAIVDSGLAAHLTGENPTRLADRPTALGPLLETFVVNELRSQIANGKTHSTMWHFRDRGGVEVDIVLELPDGRVIGIEVKATSSPVPTDLRGLRFLRERLGARFVAGVLLTLAPEAFRLGDGLYALPVSALWQSHLRVH